MGVTCASFHAARRTSVYSESENIENSGRARVSAAFFRTRGWMSSDEIYVRHVLKNMHDCMKNYLMLTWLDK